MIKVITISTRVSLASVIVKAIWCGYA